MRLRAALILAVLTLGAGVAWWVSAPALPPAPQAAPVSPSPGGHGAASRLVVLAVDGTPAAGCPFTLEGGASTLDAEGTAPWAAGELIISCGARGFFAGPATRPLTLAPMTELRVLVRDRDGAARAASLQVRPLDDAPAWAAARFSTDGEGEAARFLPPGRYEVSLERGAVRRVEQVSCEGGSVQLTWLLGDHWLAGVVKDEEGRLAPDVPVFVADNLTAPKGHTYVKTFGTVTDRSGHFRFEGLDEEPVRLEAALAARHLSAVLDTAVDCEVVLELSADPWITGRAVDERGVPVETLVLNGREVFAPDGGFVVEWTLPDLPRALDLVAPGFLPEVLPLRTLHDDLGEVRLRRGRTLRGTVVDAQTGAPLVGAPVALMRDEFSGHTLFTSRTDAQGAFTLEGVGPRARLSGGALGYTRWARTVSTATDVRIELSRGATLRVQVPPAERLRSLEAAGPEHERRATTTGTEANWATLQPGEWHLTGRVERCADAGCETFDLVPLTLKLEDRESRSVVMLPREHGLQIPVRAFGVPLRVVENLVLVPGDVPRPTRLLEVEALLRGEYWPIGRDLAFHHVAPGRYTVLLLRAGEVATLGMTVTDTEPVVLEVRSPRWGALLTP